MKRLHPMRGTLPVNDCDERASTESLGVIVNYQTWLRLTENWLYTQAKHLPASTRPFVVCGETENLSEFQMNCLFSYSALSPMQRTRILARGACRLGLALGRRTSLLAQIAEDYDAKVVHSHFGHTACWSSQAVKRLGMAHVVSFYGFDMSGLPESDARWRDRYRVLFKDVDRVLCEGPHMARKVQDLGCPEGKLRVQRLGVPVDTIPYLARSWHPGEPLRVLICASFREKKGIPYAINALSALAKDVPLKITIIGDAGPRPEFHEEKRRIHETVRKGGLEEKTRFLGYQPHSAMLEEAYKHHLFLSPSVTASNGDTEGGAPITLIEILATGMPVVTTRHADIPEVVKHGVGGFLADERDVDQLESHLRWLVENPAEWGPLARAGRSHVEEWFDAVKQGESLASIYRELVP